MDYEKTRKYTESARLPAIRGDCSEGTLTFALLFQFTGVCKLRSQEERDRPPRQEILVFDLTPGENSPRTLALKKREANKEGKKPSRLCEPKPSEHVPGAARARKRQLRNTRWNISISSCIKCGWELAELRGVLTLPVLRTCGAGPPCPPLQPGLPSAARSISDCQQT